MRSPKSSATSASSFNSVSADGLLPYPLAMSKGGAVSSGSSAVDDSNNASLSKSKSNELSRSARRFPVLGKAKFDDRQTVKRAGIVEGEMSMCLQSEVIRAAVTAPHAASHKWHGMCKGFDHSTCSHNRATIQQTASTLNSLTHSASARVVKAKSPRNNFGGPPFMPTNKSTQALDRRPALFDTPFFEGRGVAPTNTPAALEFTPKSLKRPTQNHERPESSMQDRTVTMIGDSDDPSGASAGRPSEGVKFRGSEKRQTITKPNTKPKQRSTTQQKGITLMDHGEEVLQGDSDGSDVEDVCESVAFASAVNKKNRQSVFSYIKPRLSRKSRMIKVNENRRMFMHIGTKEYGNSAQQRRSQKSFECLLAEAEVKSIKEVCMRYDADGSGDLDARECSEVLADLGLKPQSREEKMELAEIMEEVAAGESEEIGFMQLCNIVHRLRQKVQDSQSKDLFQIFQKYDEDDSGALDKDEVMKILKDINFAPQTPEEEDLITNVLREVDADGSGELEFTEFVTFVSKVREVLQILRRNRERKLKEEMDLNPDTFATFRHEILVLHENFKKFDEDDSGALDLDELKEYLAEVGLMPKVRSDAVHVDGILAEMEESGHDEVSFADVLALIQRLRAALHSQKRDEMKTLFDSYDRDRSGDLSLREVSRMLLDLGLQPKNRDEQDEIQKMMAEVDEDGSMELNFEEFLLLFQRINEKLKAMQREKERERAHELSFSEMQLADLRYAFDALDTDGSGLLEVSEIRRALQLMGKKVSSEKLWDMITEVDDDNSGELDFTEFLQLVKRMDTDATFLESAEDDEQGARKTINAERRGAQFSRSGDSAVMRELRLSQQNM